MEPTDEALVERVQKGDSNAFGILIERYEPKLMRYGKKFLARTDDITDTVHDILLSTYQNIQSFKDSLRFSPWIYRIAHNAFVNELRRQKREPYTLFDFDTFFAHTAYDDPAESERERQETRKLLDASLAQLSPKYREVLVLHYLEELPYQEIADVLTIPIGTVSVRLRRAKEALKELHKKYRNL